MNIKAAIITREEVEKELGVYMMPIPGFDTDRGRHRSQGKEN